METLLGKREGERGRERESCGKLAHSSSGGALQLSSWLSQMAKSNAHSECTLAHFELQMKAVHNDMNPISAGQLPLRLNGVCTPNERQFRYETTFLFAL